ncbi:MAG: MFS transporter [Dehalococcoidia bacterium]|nr:MFS transporter [Dehalococcoidia bacterium]
MSRFFRGAARHPDFRHLWAAQAISLVGTGLGALPFTAILFLDASGTEMALLAACGVLPGLLVGLPAGAWVDRVRRRPVLIAADLVRAVALASLLGAAAFDALRIEHLCAVALVNGAMEVLFDIAYVAYVPALVPEEELVDANARLAASASVAEASSFSAGGWIAQLAGSLWAVAADAASFVASAAFLARIRTAEPAPERPAAEPALLAEMAAGWTAIRADGRLAAIGAATVALGLGHGLIGAVILLFGTRDLGIGAGVLGLVFGVGGLTSLLGSLVAGRAGTRLGPGRAMIAGAAVFLVGTLLIVVASGPPAVGVLFLVGSQLLGDPSYTVREVNEMAVRQAVTPPAVFGRVNGALRFAQLVAMLAGSLVAAGLAPVVGSRGVLAAGLVAHVGVLAALLSSRQLRAGGPR